MDCMDEKINSKEVLNSFLARCYWLETKMEQTREWFAYLEVKSEEAKQVLFQLTKDSDNHKQMFRKLFSHIKGFDLEKTLSELSLQADNYSFKKKSMRKYFRKSMNLRKKQLFYFLEIY